MKKYILFSCLAFTLTSCKNVSSTTLIIHKPDSMTFKVELEKPKYIKSE